jgi:hypothetical protein
MSSVIAGFTKPNQTINGAKSGQIFRLALDSREVSTGKCVIGVASICSVSLLSRSQFNYRTIGI